jgi:TMEM175 potassium channel family protein
MSKSSANSRLEAFCDGVFAIAITLLIIEIKVPEPEEIQSKQELWLALKHLTPSILAFILSFTIILITWVNHHGSLKYIPKTSPAFVYANGLLLLSVAFLPFPTGMLGEFITTEYASAAVVLFNSTLALQAFSWILIASTAIKGNLTIDDHATEVIKKDFQFGIFATILYSLCAIAAIWFPVTTALITSLTWVFWLIYGVSFKHD